MLKSGSDMMAAWVDGDWARRARRWNDGLKLKMATQIENCGTTHH